MLEWRLACGTVTLCVLLATLPTAAQADVEDYCAAVARDFADLRPNDRDVWQRRYDDAARDCIADFSGTTDLQNPQTVTKPASSKLKPPKIAAVKPPKASKSKIEKQKASPDVAATADSAAKVAPTKSKILVGTPEWLDYCARKYTSFNREKGTYTSKTGVERKCLVTADFN